MPPALLRFESHVATFSDGSTLAFPHDCRIEPATMQRRGEAVPCHRITIAITTTSSGEVLRGATVPDDSTLPQYQMLRRYLLCQQSRAIHTAADYGRDDDGAAEAAARWVHAREAELDGLPAIPAAG